MYEGGETEAFVGKPAPRAPRYGEVGLELSMGPWRPTEERLEGAHVVLEVELSHGGSIR